jgi:hypothetical protein
MPLTPPNAGDASETTDVAAVDTPRLITARQTVPISQPRSRARAHGDRFDTPDGPRRDCTGDDPLIKTG